MKKTASVKSMLRKVSLLIILLGVAVLSFTTPPAEGVGTVFDPGVPGVTGTKHNLSMYGPGEVKATAKGTTQVCVFCHTPHNSSPSGALWNKEDSGATYTIYERFGTVTATLGQPNGGSKLCLSCHDGTIAVGSLLNAPGARLAGTIEMSGVRTIAPVGTLLSTSPSNLHTDLNDDHPISFLYTEATGGTGSLELNPVEINSVGSLYWTSLDSADRVQCTSCHDPHKDPYSKFLVLDYGVGSPLCAECHNKYKWTGAIHQTSAAIWNGAAPNPWHLDLGVLRNNDYSDDTPATHGCFSCHKSHGGLPGKALTKDQGNTGREEGTCLVCHNGNVASKSIEDVALRSYAHPTVSKDGLHYRPDLLEPSPARELGLDYSYIYDYASNLTYSPDRRHAECVDCHNPHMAKSGNHSVGSSGGSNAYGNVVGENLRGSWGVRPADDSLRLTNGVAADPAILTFTKVYFDDTSFVTDKVEGYLCIKCHSYWAYSNMPPSNVTPNDSGSFPQVQSDPIIDFDPDNNTFHPVFSVGKNQPPLTANPNWVGAGLSRTFQCFLDGGGNCGIGGVAHDSTITCSDCHGADSGTDPKGPHGSNNRWILKGNETTWLASTPTNFCYNCHRRDVYGDECDPTFDTFSTVYPFANYSRVSHPPDLPSGSNGCTSPFYDSRGLTTGNSSNKWGILCLSCHGGGVKVQNGYNVADGVHGSATGLGPGGGTTELSKRMMNGACVTGHTAATLATGVQLWFKTDVSVDEVCNYPYVTPLPATGPMSNYLGGDYLP